MAGFSSLICLLEYRIGGSVFEVTNLIFLGRFKKRARHVPGRIQRLDAVTMPRFDSVPQH